MIVLSSIFVALLIVCGQALWKSSVGDVTHRHIQLVSSEGVQQLLRNPKLYLGVLIYAIATVGYVILLGKYKYFQVQSIVVGGSLVLTLLLAHFMFHEQTGLINIAGVLLILAGAVLVIR